jgi:predicted transglutaminase-like cysteine proteinase
MGAGQTRADQFDASFYHSAVALQVEGATDQFASLAPFAPSAFPSLSTPAEPFGASGSSLAGGRVQAKWQGVKKQLVLEHYILQRCRIDASICPNAAKEFLAIIVKAQAREGLARMGEINRAINLAIKPVSDKEQYGVDDLWATPLMTFASHAGDCEDYAIAKFVALHEIGMTEEDLRLVIVRDRARNEDHAVVAVRHEGHWLILDNRTLAMRQDEAITAFDPLFMIDRDGVKQAQVPAAKPTSPPMQAGLGAPLWSTPQTGLLLL